LFIFEGKCSLGEAFATGLLKPHRQIRFRSVCLPGNRHLSSLVYRPCLPMRLTLYFVSTALNLEARLMVSR
jgi:hypothetical protein